MRGCCGTIRTGRAAALLESGAERTMTGMSADKIVAWFAGREPRTLEGAFRLASALITTGQKVQAQAVVRKSWTRLSMP